MIRNPKPIAVASRTFSKHPKLREELAARFSDITFNDAGAALKGAELAQFFKGKSGVIVALETISDEVLGALPELKVISKYGVGLDNIDLAAMKKRGVQLGWTGGVNKRSVAELALMFMLGSLRNLFDTSTDLSAGKWRNEGGMTLSGKTVGIIGCGHVGRDLIALLKPFGCKILVNDIVNIDEFCVANGAKSVDKDTIYREADVVSLHVPLDDSTKNLIDAKAFSKMKPTAVLVNTSRGKVVDEAALYDALKAKKLFAAASDVFAEEPATRSPLFELPNFAGSAHIGGSSAEAILAMGMSAIENLEKLLK